MTKIITAIAYDKFCFLDIVGPVDVFTMANQRAGKPLYKVNIAAVGRGKSVSAESGMRLCIDEELSNVDSTHTLLIPGGDGFRVFAKKPSALPDIKRLALKSKRVVSICTGAFILAEAGLLNKRRATTHWAYTNELAKTYPHIKVVPDALFINDGKYITSAGIAAGIDLALSIVEQDHGSALALQTSQRMVLYLNRAGGQSQFSERFESTTTVDDKFDQMLAGITKDPRGNLGNAALAERLSVSERHFARVFHERTGTTPARWVERVRVDHARCQLVTGKQPMSYIADASGFVSVDTMRQAFKRVMGVSPTQYRQNHGHAEYDR